MSADSLPAIPLGTRRKLLAPAAPGSRHHQIVQIAFSLASSGLNASAIFHQLRPNYAVDVSDDEIWSASRWAESKAGSTPISKHFHPSSKPKAQPTEAPERIADFLKGYSCTEAELAEASPIRLPEDWQADTRLFIASIYQPGEMVNIVTDYVTKAGKILPKGYGKTQPRDAWLTEILTHGTPQNEGGAWVRMNPLNGAGITDEDVSAFRFALLEFDAVPYSLQLSFLAKLPLPINAILTSGGKSLHAWVRLDAPDASIYRLGVAELFKMLAPYGIDPANKNPSRLSRLPGALRSASNSADKRQRLIYLNPGKTLQKPIC